MPKPDKTKLGNFDRTINNCEITSIPAGTAPKYIIAKLPGVDGSTVPAWWDGVLTITVGDMVSLRLAPNNQPQYIIVGGGSGTATPSAHTHPATAITADTTNFNGNLSAADDTVQKALETIDEMSGAAGWPFDNTLVVSSTNPAAYATLAAAVAVVTSGQTIELDSEVHAVGDVTIPTGVNLSGKPGAKLMIAAGNVLTFAGTSRVDTLRIDSAAGESVVVGASGYCEFFDVVFGWVAVTVTGTLHIFSGRAGSAASFAGAGSLYLWFPQADSVGMTYVGWYLNSGGSLVGGDNASFAPLRMTARSAAPSVASTNDLYMDDGTNTNSGSPGLRRYTGTAWEDIGGGSVVGGIWLVHGTTVSTHATITAAISAAAAGDTILILGGSTYTEAVNIDEVGLRIYGFGALLTQATALKTLRISAAGVLVDGLIVGNTYSVVDTVDVVSIEANDATLRNVKATGGGASSSVRGFMGGSATGLLLEHCEAAISGSSTNTGFYKSGGDARMVGGKLNGADNDISVAGGTTTLEGVLLANSTVNVLAGAVTGWYYNASGELVSVGAAMGIKTTPTRTLHVAGTIHSSQSDAAYTTASWARNFELLHGGGFVWTKGAGSHAFGMGKTGNPTVVYWIFSTADDNSAAAIYQMTLAANGNLSVGGTGSFGGGEKVISIANRTVAPSSNPSGGGVMYAESGALKWRGSSGTVTTVANAEPHCPKCGRDAVLEYKNDAEGWHIQVCLFCLTQHSRQGVIIRKTRGLLSRIVRKIFYRLFNPLYLAG